MKDWVTENNPSRMRGRGVDVPKALFYGRK